MNGAVEGVALLPCPFCGGEAKYEWHSDPDCWIECTKCGAVGPNGEDTTTEQNAAAWNTLTTPPARSYVDGVVPASEAEWVVHSAIFDVAMAKAGKACAADYSTAACAAIRLLSQGGKA